MEHTTPKRVILKISGECMSGLAKTGFDRGAIEFIAKEITEALASSKTELAIVIGGGNIVRGSKLMADIGSHTVTADQAGMLSTVINAIILQDFIERTHKVEVRVMTSFEIRSYGEPYILRRALRHLEKNRIVIMSGGTGNPRFSTDTAAVLRAIELGAHIVIKGTKVDGIYNKDPHANNNSKFIKEITQQDYMKKNLQIMDRTAITLAAENKIPIRVFNIFDNGNLRKALHGEDIGSLIVP